MELLLTAHRQDAAGSPEEGKKSKRISGGGDESEGGLQAQGKALRPVSRNKLAGDVLKRTGLHQ